MKIKRNRRTLKKRIKRATSLSALITVLFMSSVIILIVLAVSRNFAEYQSDVMSYSIQKELNSGQAMNRLGIKSINELNEGDPRLNEWVKDISRKSIINTIIPYDSGVSELYIKIEVQNRIIYSNELEAEEQNNQNSSDLFEDTEAVKPIMDSNNNEIGNIYVRVNPQFLLVLLIPVFSVIISLSGLALIIAKILSMFLVIPIINPLKQLEAKVKALAEGDQERAANTDIVLKKPLREIESLADSTNAIMKKLKSYNEILENQKFVLENQNTELELQNDELLESKIQIHKQQAQLVQTEKMASVGLLMAAITHEINTPIGAINSNAQLEEMILGVLLNHPAVEENDELIIMFSQLKEANDVNLMACSRIIEIIKSLKSFSRLDQADFQEADINEGIRSVLVLTNNLLKRRITVHEDYADIPRVKCYPGQLNQVIMNIIVNASQAIEGEGEIFIKTYQQNRDVYISIKDTGIGINEENVSKIFDPGFTTKGVGIGLGLGLYISYNIVQNHNGEISVISEPGNGAEFIIRIPMDNART